MFWSIPVSESEIVTQTPFGIKSVKAMYFEPKNGGVRKFGGSSVPDTITISIGGKIVARDLMILPFCTMAANGIDRLEWERVCIKIGLNVENAEVRISGLRNNDFNVVMVCSREAVDEIKGFEMIETKWIWLRPDITFGGGTLADWTEWMKNRRAMSRPQGIENHGEKLFATDYPAEYVFAYPFGSENNATLYNNTVWALNGRQKITIGGKTGSLGGMIVNMEDADKSLLPDDMDFALIATGDKVAWRDCAWKVDTSLKEISVRLDIDDELWDGLVKASDTDSNTLPRMWVKADKSIWLKSIGIALMFMYHKI